MLAWGGAGYQDREQGTGGAQGGQESTRGSKGAARGQAWEAYDMENTSIAQWQRGQRPQGTGMGSTGYKKHGQGARAMQPHASHAPCPTTPPAPPPPMLLLG